VTPDVVVAMSGGVDSSTAAALLRQEGYRVVGLTMKLWQSGSECCSAQDVADARRVAVSLGIPHYVLDLSSHFRREVLEPSISEYKRGRTPNPCVVCNERLKFGLLLKRTHELGARNLATGHYARVDHDPVRRRTILKRGLDPSKEQSYWLSTLPQTSLQSALFPLGSRSKEETRRLASDLGLRVARKRESQDVCWTGGFREVVREAAQPQPGPVLDRDGNCIGQHEGIHFYTIGQRRGLGIAGGRPLYITKIDRASNIIVVGPESELYRNGFLGTNANWIGMERLEKELKVDVQIRYRGRPAQAVISPEGNAVAARFLSPERAITPGQLAVFYRQEEVVGACWIEKVR
jgi:tRNA-specific 2-thiouridylase